ncbi:MAG: DEAD/DEAH box helicase, partial [Pseudomonadota bacterium]
MNSQQPALSEDLFREPEAAAQRATVLFPLPLFQTFDYLYDGPETLEPGVFVRAPFGPREVIGVVWPQSGAAAPAAEKLKKIAGPCDAPPLAADIIDFVEWAARYTMSPLGSVLRLVMRAGDAVASPKLVKLFEAAGAPPERMTPQRQAVLRAMEDGPKSAAALAQAAGVTDGVVRGLAKAGALRAMMVDPDPPFEPPDLSRKGADLSADQTAALNKHAEAIAENRSGAVLIDGVTGSGKTEVYLEAIARALRADEAAQALILIPEIALTLPFLKRVEERFGAAPAPWHSGMSGAQRRRVWRRVADGGARLVVGARSALFLPFQRLKLVVVDEEHDGAYKQEDGVIYHARDLAVARGARAGFPVVLASAT